MKDFIHVQREVMVLGISIIRDRKNRTVTFCQDKHISTLLEKFSPTKGYAKTPISCDINLLLTDTSPPTDQPYRELIGTLTHLMNVSRPDIFMPYLCFPVSHAIPVKHTGCTCNKSYVI